MKLNPVTQRMLETYQEYLVTEGREAQSSARINRLVVEAAVKAGFAEDAPKDLLDLAPHEITRMSAAITDHIRKALDVPGE